jgi:hypothetical protein
MTPRLTRRGLLAVLPTATFITAPALAQKSAGLKFEVVEVARSVDVGKERREFLAVTVEVTGLDPARLRRLQPLRDDFTLIAGKQLLPCRRLRGGSLPDDPERLRFTLSFSPPPAGIKAVDLRIQIPAPGEDAIEIKLVGLKPGNAEQVRKGDGWALTITRFGESPYSDPPLPPEGGYVSKGGPVDVRIVRRSTGEAPGNGYLLEFRTDEPALYDRSVDISGSLLTDAGSTPLLSGMLRRDPSRAVANPIYGPYVSGRFFFAVPGKGQVTGAVLRLRRRSNPKEADIITLRDLPVPGG